MTQTQDWNTQLTLVGQTQDKAAFANIFEHFSPLLKTYLMRAANLKAEQAEELVQETMIKVWRRAPTFSPDQASASTWIYTIARNNRIDWYRKQAKQEQLVLQSDDIYGNPSTGLLTGSNSGSPYANLVARRQQDSIKAELTELPQEQSQVLKMMYFHGLSGQQVANLLKLPLGTVKSRVRLALGKLRVSLAPLANATKEGNQDD